MLAALNVMLLLTIALFGSVANGVYFLAARHPVAVDFVGQHDDAPAQADLADAGQLRRRPAIPGRVLRVAEDERVGVMADLALEIVEVDGEAAVHHLHPALLRERARVAQVAIEPVVGRRRQQHLAADRRERAQRGDQSGVHAGGDVQQRRVDGDAVTLLVPGDDAFGKRLGDDHVAPDVVLHPFLERLGNRRRGAEIHVRDAHAGDDVILVGEPGVDGAVPLGGVGADAAVGRVEVELAVGGRGG